MTSHARHDRFAIAAAIGGGLPPATLRTCPACGSLHRDLLSIQAAIRHAWTPRRPRDLRLDQSDLERHSAGHAPAIDPRIVVSGVSLGAGGTILGIRRITSRGRAMR
jgi:hypothetical protein